MASISREPGGRRTIQFIGADGKRRSIRLGKASDARAESVRTWVEVLSDAKAAGGPLEPDMLRWLAKIDAGLATRLAAVGLITPRERPALAAFLDKYADGRSDVKRGTRLNHWDCRKKLVKFFGPDKPLREISPGDADAFRQWLAGKGFAENSLRKLSGICKLFFRAAVRKRLIDENPFADLKGTTQPITRSSALSQPRMPDASSTLALITSGG